MRTVLHCSVPASIIEAMIRMTSVSSLLVTVLSCSVSRCTANRKQKKSISAKLSNICRFWVMLLYEEIYLLSKCFNVSIGICSTAFVTSATVL